MHQRELDTRKCVRVCIHVGRPAVLAWARLYVRVPGVSAVYTSCIYGCVHTLGPRGTDRAMKREEGEKHGD